MNDDLISRSALIKEFERFGYTYRVTNIIDNAPTVEVRDNFDLGYIQGLEDGKKERQKGKWINKGIYYECPFCQAGYMKSIFGKTLDLNKMNFCFNCGAKMEDEDNGH